MYRGNVESKGVCVVSAHYVNKKRSEFEIWDYAIDNVMNSVFTQGNLKFKLKDSSNLMLAGQFIRQDAINQGGNMDPILSYTQKGAKSMTFGAKVAYKKK